MKNDFVVGNNYYLKVKLSLPLGVIFKTGSAIKYRLDNGSWTNSPTGTANVWIMHLTLGEFISFRDSSDVEISYIDLSTHDLLEWYGGFSELIDVSLEPIPTTDQRYKYFKVSAIDSPEEINVYQLTGEEHLVTKTLKLTLKDTIYGVFRENINVLTPSILIEYDALPTFNYVYIPSLNRYYFVVSINCVRRNVYQIDLKVDVLYTYDVDIRKQNCYVSRNENTYDTSLVDERRPTEDIPTIFYRDCSTFRNAINAVNCAITPDDFDGYNYVVTNVTGTTPSSDITPPSNASLLPTIGKYTSSIISYAIKISTASKIQSAFAMDDTKVGYNYSLIVYPFDVSDFTNVQPEGYETGILFGDYNIDDGDLSFVEFWDCTNPVLGRQVYTASLGYAIIEDFTISASFSGVKEYLNYEPYLTMEMFIPFVGWVKVNPKEIYGNRVMVYYGIDILSGFATAYVYVYETKKRCIYSTTCQIGVKLPITTSNKFEIEREKQNNVNNLTLGLISSGLSLGIGAVTQNPLGMIGGVLSVAQAIKSYTNANNLMFERGQVTFTSTETAFYQPQNKVWIKETYHNPRSITESTFGKLNGYPLRNYTDLTSITGYTEIPDMHYEPSTQLNITKSEIDEIVSLARGGIIL